MELTRVVRGDYGRAEQTMMADGTPYPGFGEKAHELPIEDIDTLAGQMLQESNLVRIWRESYS